MKLICPYCQGRVSLEEALREGDHAVWAGLLAEFGQHWRLVLEYVELWGPGPGRPPTLKKQIRILSELARLWQAGEFAYYSRRYRVTVSDVVAALKAVVDARPERLKNHNYLKKVLVPRADRLSAEGLTAREEQRREEERRAGIRREDIPEVRELPPEIQDRVDRITGGSG